MSRLVDYSDSEGSDSPSASASASSAAFSSLPVARDLTDHKSNFTFLAPSTSSLVSIDLAPAVPDSDSSLVSSSVSSFVSARPNHTLANIKREYVPEFSFAQSYNQKSARQLHAGSEVDRERSEELRKRRRLGSNNPADIKGFRGSWANNEDLKAIEAIRTSKFTDIQSNSAVDSVSSSAVDASESVVVPSFTPSSQLHLASAYDYQGRSYLHPPSDFHALDYSTQRCFVPKTCLHTFTGHQGPVQVVRFLPHSGHLLFSAGSDKTVKIWQLPSRMNSGYACIRTITAHSEGIRSMDLTSTGARFATAAFDRTVRVFDAETGQCVVTLRNEGAMPICTRFFPANENELLVGQANKRIVQWDIRANEIGQQYNEHLDAVNSVTFYDGNRKFVSTSDDKKVLAWEYGIPVVIKYISDLELHSMPRVALHPLGKSMIAQSQDNQIVVLNADDKPKLNRKKHFKGHFNAGYACDLGFSPDGSLVYSGDGHGRLFLWDWKTGKLFKRINAHQQVCISVDWQPNSTSRMATCSWDGTIKYWD